MPSLARWIKTFSPPVCPDCKIQLVFVRASDEQPDFKQRKFKCALCGYAEVDIVKVGPMLKTRDIA